MRATRAGAILGTTAYISPEYAHGRTANRHADIFLYEMLTGARALHGRIHGRHAVDLAEGSLSNTD